MAWSLWYGGNILNSIHDVSIHAQQSILWQLQWLKHSYRDLDGNIFREWSIYKSNIMMLVDWSFLSPVAVDLISTCSQQTIYWEWFHLISFIGLFPFLFPLAILIENRTTCTSPSLCPRELYLFQWILQIQIIFRGKYDVNIFRILWWKKKHFEDLRFLSTTTLAD